MASDPSPETAQIAYLDVGELQSRLSSGELTAVTLVETFMQRIADLDLPESHTALRSVIAVSDRALAEAEASDRRRAISSDRLALEGIPVLVKDNIEVSGLPSSAGSTSLLGRPPASDAPLVTRLRQAGAVILGATNLSEWANIRSPRSTGGWSAVGGLTANPWALDRNAGGSSSGSGAALAAGLAPLAIGTETDGSVCCPCSLNGVAGIKPAVGSVPTAGVVPISPSQDSPGPMARTVADVRLLLDVLTRTTVPSENPQPLPSIRVAVATTWRTGHPATDSLFDETAERIRSHGVPTVEVAPAGPTGEAKKDESTVLLCELKDALDLYLPTRGPGGPQTLAEVVAYEDCHADVELAWFGHELFEQALALGGRAGEAYRDARRRNLSWALGTVLEPALASADVLVAAYMGPAWKSDLILGGHPASSSPATMAPAVAGWPIACVPMGLAAGLPVGVALIGRPGSERAILALAAAVEVPGRPTWTPPTRS